LKLNCETRAARIECARMKKTSAQKLNTFEQMKFLVEQIYITFEQNDINFERKTHVLLKGDVM
jgi:hypothetical protein